MKKIAEIEDLTKPDILDIPLEIQLENNYLNQLHDLDIKAQGSKGDKQESETTYQEIKLALKELNNIKQKIDSKGVDSIISKFKKLMNTYFSTRYAKDNKDNSKSDLDFSNLPPAPLDSPSSLPNLVNTTVLNRFKKIAEDVKEQEDFQAMYDKAIKENNIDKAKKVIDTSKKEVDGQELKLLINEINNTDNISSISGQNTGFLFHGTTSDRVINNFNLGKSNWGVGSNAFAQGNKGVYLTNDLQAARYFSRKAGEFNTLMSPEIKNKYGDNIQGLFDEAWDKLFGSRDGNIIVVKLANDTKIKELNHYPSDQDADLAQGEGFNAISFPEAGLNHVEDYPRDVLGMSAFNSKTFFVMDPSKIQVVSNINNLNDLKSFAYSLNKFRKVSAILDPESYNPDEFLTEDIRREAIEEYALKACNAIISKHKDLRYNCKNGEIKISNGDDAILKIQVNEYLNITSIVPVNHLQEIYPYHSQAFYQKYWKPIVESVGHICLSDPSIIIVATSSLPDVPKNSKSFYLECWNNSKKIKENIELSFCGEIPTWLFKSTSIRTAQNNLSSKYVETDYLNAVVKCIDSNLKTIFGRTGAVIQVMLLTDIIEIDVDFGRGLGIVRLTEKQIEIVPLER